MGMFKEYTRYYDLFYKNKDYKKEAGYVDRIIKQYAVGDKRALLDIGCGTGRHDRWFADHGYRVVGIDRSEEMISIAKARAIQGNNGVEFYVGDSACFDLKRKFDAAVALFHVMSYQVRDELFLRTLKNVHKHLNNHGLFIFDFWYGPAVLADGPEARQKDIRACGVKIRRRVTPKINFNDNRIDISLEVVVNQNGVREKIQELHPMRYFFLPELKRMLKSAGFKLKKSFKWLSLRQGLTCDDWNGLIIAERRA